MTFIPPMFSGMSLSASVWVISANGPAWLTGFYPITYLSSGKIFSPENQSALLYDIALGSDFGVEAGLSGASGIIAATTTACLCNVSTRLFLLHFAHFLFLLFGFAIFVFGFRL